jgi:predicted phage-related endonuclease
MGAIPDVEENEAMRWGKLLESIVASEAGKQIGGEVSMHGMMLRSVEHPHLFCTLDAMILVNGDEYPLEIKCTNRQWNWDLGQIPDDFRIQVQHQLIVTGHSHAYIAILASGNRLYWTKVMRDEAMQAWMIDRLGSFWSSIRKGSPPEIDGSASSKATLDALFPEEVSGKIVMLPADVLDLDLERQMLKADVERSTIRIDEIDNQIRMLIASGEEGHLPDGTVYRWKTVKFGERVVAAGSYRSLRRIAAKKG